MTRINKKLIIASGCGVLFILLNCFAIVNQFLYIPVLSAIAVLFFLFVFRWDLLMYFMAFATPFSIIFSNEKVNIGLSVPAEIIMILFTFLFFLRLLYEDRLERKIVFHPISILIYIYLIWMLISSITSEIPLVSFKFLASKIWFITACYFCVIQLIKNNFNKIVIFINCYAAALGMVIIVTTIKLALSGFAKRGMHWIMHPFYNDHTAYGAAIVFFIPLIIALFAVDRKTIWKKLYYLFLLAILSMGLYFSFCRAAWLSIILAFGVYVVIRLRIKFSWFVVGITILCSTLYYFSDDIIYKMSKNTQDSSGEFSEHLTSISNISTDASNVERINRWVSAFGMIEERPVIGWGPGTYQFLYAGYQKNKYKTIITTNFGDGGNAHSEFIGPTAESGFVGLATVLALMLGVLYTGISVYISTKRKNLRVLTLAATLALISYYIHGLMNNFLDTDKLSLPFWMAVAIIVVVDIMNKKNTNEHHPENTNFC